MTWPGAILLDLDDTIIDDSSLVGPIWRQLSVEAALDGSGLDGEAIFDAIQRTRSWYWSDPYRHRIGRLDLPVATYAIVRQALESVGCVDEDVARKVANDYRARREASAQLFPDAIETLIELRRRGIGLALVTNGAGPSQRAKIERFGLAGHFDHIFIEGEFGIGKPDERVYRAALAALGQQPRDTWMVGDNLEWEVAVPQRLGIYAIWMDVRRAGLPPESDVRPNRIIRALSELL